MKGEGMQTLETNATPAPARLAPKAVSIAHAAEMLGGISRAHIYRLIARGELRTVKSGARRLVPVEAIDEYLARMCA